MILSPIKELINFKERTFSEKEIENKEVEIFPAKANITTEQKNDVQKTDSKLDVDALIQNVLLSELTQGFEGIVLRKMFDLSKENNPIVYKLVNENHSYNIKDFDEVLSKYKETGFTFIVTNVQVGTFISDSSNFVASEKSNPISLGLVYFVGKYDGIDVYVNPFMKWTDNRILLAKKSDSSISMECEVKIESSYQLDLLNKIEIKDETKNDYSLITIEDPNNHLI